MRVDKFTVRLHTHHCLLPQTLRDTQRELRDAQREGRLREELSDQAKESRGKLRELWRKYGAVGIGVYFSIYFGSIAVFYGVYDYGVMTNLPSGGAAVIERVSLDSSLFFF